MDDDEIIALGRVIVVGLVRNQNQDIWFPLTATLDRFRRGLRQLSLRQPDRGLALMHRAATSKRDLERMLAAECLATVSTYDLELAVELAIQMGKDESRRHGASSEVALLALGEIERAASPEQMAYVRAAKAAADLSWWGD